MTTHGDGGKGSERRPGAGYQDGWDRIFAKKLKQEDACPRCGADDYDTIAWSLRSGVEPFDTYHECRCGKTWQSQN